MKVQPSHRYAIFALGLGMALGASPGHAINLVISDSGVSPSDIELSVDAFRTVLNSSNEVTWDDVSDAGVTPNALSADYYRSRGLALTTPGSGFHVSATDSSEGPPFFGNFNAPFSVNFEAFSGPSLFSPIGSVITEVRFLDPGSGAPALTDGFGAVFTGVEIPGASRLDYFDSAGDLIISELVPEGGPGSLSFVGAVFDSNKLAQVRIISGELPIDLAGAGDHVALDNFIFGQLQPIPEPTVGLLIGLSAYLLFIRRRQLNPQGS